MLQGGVTWAETEYGDDPLPDADLFLLPGSTISFAPELSATASVGYDWEFADDLVARFHIGAKYSSEYNTGSDLDPEKLQEAYTVANARIGIGRRDRRWMLELWGQNITDEEYMQVAFDAPLQTGSWNAFLAAPQDVWGDVPGQLLSPADIESRNGPRKRAVFLGSTSR